MNDILDVNVGLRPCTVTHKVKGKDVEKRAIFHGWTQSIVGKTKTNEIIVQTLALVEYEDGSLAQVKAKSLRFTDGMVRYFYEVMDSHEEDTEEQIQM